MSVYSVGSFTREKSKRDAILYVLSDCEYGAGEIERLRAHVDTLQSVMANLLDKLPLDKANEILDNWMKIEEVE